MPIWDTIDNDDLAKDDRYSPSDPGLYTWPIEGEEGFYSMLYVGRYGPSCESEALPPGVTYKGCFSNETPSRFFNKHTMQLPTKGHAGMTVEVSHPHHVARLWNCGHHWASFLPISLPMVGDGQGEMLVTIMQEDIYCSDDA